VPICSMSASPALGRSISTAAAASYIRVDVTRAYAPARCSASRLPYRSTENIHLTSTSVHARNHAASFTDETARSRERVSGVGTMGTGGYIVPPKFRTCTPCTPQVKDAAYVKILSKRLQLQDCIRFVQSCTPHLRKRSDAPRSRYSGH